MVTWRYRLYEGDPEIEFDSEETEIHRAAEDLSAYQDQQSAEYPDERTFDLWCPKQERWRTIRIDAENVRQYSARETWESLDRATAERANASKE